jgi:hypothetical protein
MYQCSESGYGSGSVSHRYGSEDTDLHPDPYQNVTDPQHCLYLYILNALNCVLCCRPIAHSPPAKRQPKKCFVQTTDWLTGTFIQDGGPTLVVSALSLLSGPEGGASFRLQFSMLSFRLFLLLFSPLSVAPPFALHPLISSIFFYVTQPSKILSLYFPFFFSFLCLTFKVVSFPSH